MEIMQNKKNDFVNVRLLSLAIWLFIPILFLTSFDMPQIYAKTIVSIVLYLTILGWILVSFKRNGVKHSLVFGKIKSWRELFLSLVFSIIIGVISLFIVMAIFNIILKFDPNFFNNSQYMEGIPLIADVFLTIAIAPLVEEIFFRGYLLNRLCEKYTIGKSIFIASIIFSLVHLEQFLGVLLFGFFISIIYVKTRSLLISIICHSVYNSWAYIMSFSLSNNDFIKLMTYSPIVLMILLPIAIYSIYKFWPSTNFMSPYEHNKANL